MFTLLASLALAALVFGRIGADLRRKYRGDFREE